MRAFSSNNIVGVPAFRNRVAVHATVAPSKPQQVTSKNSHSINAKVNYVQPAPNGEELFAYLYEKPDNVSKVTNLEHVEIEVPITDLREFENQERHLTLQRNGFQLEKLNVPSDIDWANNDEVGSSAP